MPAKLQPPPDLRWDDVRLFLAAYRQRSLGAAAVRLGVDISTVSRRIAALEASLGARLFERTRQGLVPTRSAEVVLPAAEAMEAGHARLVRDASGVDTEVEGVVRLSAAPGMVETFLTPLLVRLHERHPRVVLELDASMRTLDLTRHEADLALRSTKPQGAELVVTRLTTARWVAATSPRLAKRLGRLEAWSDAPWIAWDRDLASFGPARWLAQQVPRAQVLLRTSHFGAQLGAAEAGLGVALIPEPYVRVRRLQPVAYAPALAPSAQAWPVDDLWMVAHRALRSVPRVAAVWTFFAEELRRMTA